MSILADSGISEAFLGGIDSESLSVNRRYVGYICVKKVSVATSEPLQDSTCYSLVNHLYPSFWAKNRIVTSCHSYTYNPSNGLSIRRLRVRVPSASLYKSIINRQLRLSSLLFFDLKIGVKQPLDCQPESHSRTRGYECRNRIVRATD